jgi:hypothetical protein
VGAEERGGGVRRVAFLGSSGTGKATLTRFVTVKALIDRYLPKQVELITLSVADLEERKQIVCSALG